MATKKIAEPIKPTVDIEEFKRQRKLVEQQAREVVDTNMREIKRLLSEINSWVEISGIDFNAKEEIADFYGDSWKTSSDYC